MVMTNGPPENVLNLFNILSGEMSLIGPRPMEPERVDMTDPV
jgi:lipopolysaccharide/colanic/teichoic acid biosynthesis glycosyltransferase